MMAFAIIFTACVLAFALAGAAVERGLLGALRASGPPPGPATCVALGMCFFGFSAALLSLAGITRPLAAQAIALLALGVVGLRRRRALPRPSRPPLRATHAIAIALALALLAARVWQVLYVCARWPLHQWDAIAIWGLKAKVLLAEPMASSSYFSDLGLSYSHLDYPLMLPLLYAQLYAVLGAVDDATVMVFGPLTYLVLLGVFYELASRFGSRAQALVFTLALACTEEPARLVATGCADVLLSVFIVLSAGHAASWSTHGTRDDLALAAVFASAAVFTKNEGLAAGGLVLLASFGARVARLRAASRMAELVRDAVGASVVVLLLTGPWLLFRSAIPKVHEDYGGRIDAAQLIAGLPRWREVGARFVDEVSRWQAWQLLWWLPLLAIALHPRGALAWARVPVLASLLGMLLVYGAVYSVTPWNLDELMRVSMSRLLAHLAPLALLFVAMVAGALERSRSPDA